MTCFLPQRFSWFMSWSIGNDWGRWGAAEREAGEGRRIGGGGSDQERREEGRRREGSRREGQGRERGREVERVRERNSLTRRKVRKDDKKST